MHTALRNLPSTRESNTWFYLAQKLDKSDDPTQFLSADRSDFFRAGSERYSNSEERFSQIISSQLHDGLSIPGWTLRLRSNERNSKHRSRSKNLNERYTSISHYSNQCKRPRCPCQWDRRLGRDLKATETMGLSISKPLRFESHPVRLLHCCCWRSKPDLNLRHTNFKAIERCSQKPFTNFGARAGTIFWVDA
jgi:hypothetical protein